MGRRFARSGGLALVVGIALASGPRAGAAGGGISSITSAELREWLSFIASDDLQGRATFSAGIGLAAGYVEDHLKAWGARPAGDPGSYLQTVRVLGVKTTSRSTVTVDVNGETRTFADGGAIAFPKNMGGRQRFTVDRVEFAGYGLDVPSANHLDLRGRDVKGAAVVWLGAAGPRGLDQSQYRRALAGRNRYATEQLGAAAAIGVATAGPGAGRASTSGAANGAIPSPDFTTVQRLDTPVPPRSRPTTRSSSSSSRMRPRRMRS